MSKMRMPEMSIVRFEESDVICASRVTILNIQDSGADGKNNGKVYQNGVEVGNNLDGSFTTFFQNYGTNGFYRADDDSPISLSTLVNDDRSGVAIDNFDGDYEFDGNGFWKKQ